MSNDANIQYELRLAEFEITTHCNRSCPFCYIGEALNTEEMSLQQVGILLEEARELEIDRVVLTGGEPLLHSGFEHVVGLSNDCGVPIGVLTNGDLLTRKLMASLRGRISFIQLSLHDLPDNDPFAARTLERVTRLRGVGIPVTILITVSARNIKHLGALFDLVDDLGVPVGVQRFCSVGERTLEGFKMEPDEYERALHEIWSRLQNNDTLACEDPLLNRLMPEATLSLVPDSTWIGCSAGRWAAAVAVSGKLMPCVKLRISDRNVFECGLAKAWHESEIFHQLRTGYSGSACESCTYFRVCRGCRAEAYHKDHNIWGIDPLCRCSSV